MYKGVIPFITLQLLALGVVGFYPSLVNYLPNRVSFLSETSPPPKNPKLQYCIEKYVGENVLTDENNVKKAVFRVREVDLTTLPKTYQSLVIKSVDDVNKGLGHLNQAFKIEEEINKKAVDQHRQVLDKFGRYPQRNSELGRPNTREEKAWLADKEKLPTWAGGNLSFDKKID